ncbi:MAG: FAD-dependent oxidoreductase [Solirubrobacteraceae bacterium]
MVAGDREFQTVIIGAGVAGLEAALTLRDLAPEYMQITLVEPREEFHFRPMAVSEPFSGVPMTAYSIAEILVGGNITIVADSFRRLDPERRVLHTEGGQKLTYDALLLSLGARSHPRYRDVVTVDATRIGDQLTGFVSELDEGRLRSVAFVVPSLPIWSLPAYELALMTAARAAQHGQRLDVALVTPENVPLAGLGVGPSKAVSGLLKDGGVTMITSARPQVRDPRTIELHPSCRALSVDRIVALPELFAPSLPGVPANADRGFISIDAYGAVRGLRRVYAAGDITDTAVKNGGLAAAQGVAAAEAMAMLAGAEVTRSVPTPLLGVMLVGGPRTLYISSRMSGVHGVEVVASEEALWEPSGKPHAAHLGARLSAIDAARESAVHAVAH